MRIIDSLEPTEAKKAVSFINSYGDDALEMFKEGKSFDEVKKIVESGRYTIGTDELVVRDSIFLDADGNIDWEKWAPNGGRVSGTIKENICMSKPYQEETMNKALEVSQAKEFVSRLPQGIESAVVQGGKNFSGGQRQRLTIARALYKQADILVLDDCSSALDYATDAALQKQLQELKEMTKIVISQRTASLKRCDRIMVLYHGELVGFDCHEELLKNCTVYKEIYESQNSKDGDLNG